MRLYSLPDTMGWSSVTILTPSGGTEDTFIMRPGSGRGRQHGKLLSISFHHSLEAWSPGRAGSNESLSLLTHDVQGDPGLLGQAHVGVGGHASVPRAHVSPVQPLDGQGVLHRALLIGDVGFVNDGVVSVPQNTRGRLACKMSGVRRG